MKKILPVIFIITIALLSCEKDELDEYDVRDEYVGFYKATDSCSSFTSDYELEIFKANAYDEIVFGFPGLYETGFDVDAIVTGMKIIIPIQRFNISAVPEIFYEFTGSGSLEDSLLIVDYNIVTVQDGLIIDQNSCTAYMTKDIIQ